MRRLSRTLGGLLVTLLATAACASTRGVRVGSGDESGSGTTYRIEVVNQTSRQLTVYWSDGGEPRALGGVSAGRTEYFIIAGNRTNTVTITANDASGTTRSGPHSVTLQAGVTRRVQLR
jgi:hypothetical protein